MLEKINKYWSDLNVTVKVNKRELVLGAAVCTLTGLVVGMFVSPRTTLNPSFSPSLSIGSNNTSNNSAPLPEDAEDE